MDLKRRSAIVICIILLAGCFTFSAAALNNGAYVGSVLASCHNPDTGSADDSGINDPAQHEELCRSLTNPTGMIEVDRHGGTWLTLRLKTGGAGAISLGLHTGANTYTPVPYDITSEAPGSGWVDYRINVPSPGTRIQAMMHVPSLGQDVTWYLTLDPNTLQPGTGDFVSSIDTSAPQPSQPAVPPQPTPKPSAPAPAPKPSAPAQTPTPPPPQTNAPAQPAPQPAAPPQGPIPTTPDPNSAVMTPELEATDDTPTPAQEEQREQDQEALMRHEAETAKREQPAPRTVSQPLIIGLICILCAIGAAIAFLLWKRRHL